MVTVKGRIIARSSWSRITGERWKGGWMNQVSSEGSDFKIQCLVVSLLLFRRISAGNAGLGGRKAEGALLS